MMNWIRIPQNLRQMVPAAPIFTGKPGSSTQLHWVLPPFSKLSKTKYQSYKSSSTEYMTKENLHATAVLSSLEQLKITYGALAKKCSSCWAT
jgi:hypothetical protein